MAERVSTGGNISFDYKKANERKLNHGERKEIDEAYEKYYERKKKERRKRLIFGIVIALIIIALILFLFFRKSI